MRTPEPRRWENITSCQESVTDDLRNAGATASPVSWSSFPSTPPHLHLSVSPHLLLCLNEGPPLLFATSSCPPPSSSFVSKLLCTLMNLFHSVGWTTVALAEVESTPWSLPGVPAFYRASQAAGGRFTQVQGRNLWGKNHSDANSFPAVGYVVM